MTCWMIPPSPLLKTHPLPVYDMSFISSSLPNLRFLFIRNSIWDDSHHPQGKTSLKQKTRFLAIILPPPPRPFTVMVFFSHHLWLPAETRYGIRSSGIGSDLLQIFWPSWPSQPKTKIWMFPKIGVPQNGWFIMENPIKIDDLGVPLFSETSIYIYTYIPQLPRLHQKKGGPDTLDIFRPSSPKNGESLRKKNE